MKRIFVTKKSQGYVLILTVLVIAAASLTITLGLSKLLLDQLILQTSQADGLKALALAETCAEDGLERLRNNWQDYNYILSINGNSCTINIVTDDFQAQLISTGSSGDYTKRINVTIDRAIEVVSWQQM
jgi:hypothetical protein